MRISDWSSDVCSSDLPRNAPSARNGGWFRHCRTGQWRPLRYFPASHRLNRTKGEDEGASYAHLCGQAVDKARNSMAPDTRTVSSPHRSEEHTSELQSLMRNSYDVFFLQKKNNTH